MESKDSEFKNTKTISIFIFCLASLLFLSLLLFIFLSPSQKSSFAAGKPTVTFDSTKSMSLRDTARIDSIKRTVISSETKSVKVDSSSTAIPKLCADCIKDRLDTSFQYFILLFGVMVLLTLIPRLKNFKVSKDGVEGELFDLAKAFNEAQNQSAQNPLLPQGGKTTTPEMMRTFTEEKVRLAEQFENSDPQKGKWGGLAVSNQRVLTASIKKIVGSEWADVTLKVQSTNINAAPLTGFVVFHLHPTFSNSTPIIIVLDGIAELKIQAWGAFTVGAVADKGNTKLELDLKEHPEAFEPFSSR